MTRALVDQRRRSRPLTRMVVLGASAAVLCLGGPLSNAWAQQSSAPALDSLQPRTTPWPAPVGHRQPRRSDLPSGTSKREGAITPGQRDFDSSLDICRC